MAFHMKFNHKNKPENEQMDAEQKEQTDNTETTNADINEETPSGLEKEVAELKDALQESNDKYLRLVAEFDNFRKRNAKERNELIKNAGEDVIKSLLDILDDAERA